MATIASQRAASACLLIICASLVLPACERPRITRATPEVNRPTIASPTLGTSVLPTAPTEPVEISTYTIDRIAMATKINDANEPMPEVAVIPESAKQFYLCIKAEGLPQGARFRAYWLEDGKIIGQSDRISIEPAGHTTWVALEYHPPFPLKPEMDHAVELLIDDQKIDRYVFRVGSGDAQAAVAEAAFANRFNDAGQPVGVKSRFPIDTAELTLRVRISSKVDPAGLALATLWYRGDAQVAERAPDPAPEGQQTPTAASARQFAFTWKPDAPLTPGEYHVVLLLNGNDARTVPFVVLDADGNAPPASPERSSTPPRNGTATSAQIATIRSVMVTEDVDRDTDEPVNGRIREWQADAGSTVDLWVAARVANLTTADVVEVLVSRDDVLFASDRMPAKNADNGWVALPITFEAPSAADQVAEYDVVVLLNGSSVGSTSVTLRAIGE